MHFAGCVSAFDILMRSSRLQSQPALPPTIVEPRNKKQQLHNDFISFLSKKGFKWRAGETASSGETFIKAMVDTLWEIDGQHDVFKERFFQFPLVSSLSLAITNHICRSIASVMGKICHPRHFAFVLILCSDACKESTGSDMV